MENENNYKSGNYSMNSMLNYLEEEEKVAPPAQA